MRDTIIETVTVTEASLVDGKDGDQWQVKMNVPSIGSSYPTGPCFMPREMADSIKKNEQVRVKLTRGRPKRGKDNSDREWDYWWEVASWGTEEPAPAPPRSAGSGQPEKPAQAASGPSGLDTRIAWNSAVNNAVALVAANVVTGPQDEDWSHLVRKAAIEVHEIIVAGPPQEPLETWEPTGEPPQEATERPQAAPVSKGGKPWCVLHDKGLGEINQDGQKTYAHPHPDGGWCYGVTEEADA